MKVIRKEILVGAGIVFALLCLCAALLYLSLVRPRAIEKASVDSEFSARQTELDSLSADRMKGLLGQAEKKRAELKSYVVLSGLQGELSIRLRTLASTNKLDAFSVKETSSPASQELTYISEQRMRITFTGDYIGFARFVRALENNQPLVFVDGFKVTHLTDDPTRISADIDSAVLNEGKK
jgi:hypothetical protein